MAKFKQWLKESNSGPPGGLEPPKENPEALLRNNRGAMPYYTMEPLPGNKKPMKKK